MPGLHETNTTFSSWKTQFRSLATDLDRQKSIYFLRSLRWFPCKNRTCRCCVYLKLMYYWRMNTKQDLGPFYNTQIPLNFSIYSERYANLYINYVTYLTIFVQIFRQFRFTNRITVFFWTFPSSGVLETRKHNVPETGSVSVLRWKGGEDTYSVGPFRKS
jgi:hypothetical protein